MEVHFTPEQKEAVERLISYEDWFSREVEKGLVAAGSEELIDHGEVRRIIETRLDGRQSGQSPGNE